MASSVLIGVTGVCSAIYGRECTPGIEIEANPPFARNANVDVLFMHMKQSRQKWAQV